MGRRQLARLQTYMRPLQATYADAATLRSFRTPLLNGYPLLKYNRTLPSFIDTGSNCLPSLTIARGFQPILDDLAPDLNSPGAAPAPAQGSVSPIHTHSNSLYRGFLNLALTETYLPSLAL